MLRYLQDSVQPICVAWHLVGFFLQHELSPVPPAIPPLAWFEKLFLSPLQVTVSEGRETIKIVYLSLLFQCRGFNGRKRNNPQPYRPSHWSFLFAFAFRELPRFRSLLGLRYPDGRGNSVDLESFHKSAITCNVSLAFKLTIRFSSRSFHAINHIRLTTVIALAYLCARL